MKTIANFGTLQEAQALKLNLGSMGIEVFIPDEVSAGIAPYFFVNQAGVRVQVGDDDEERAREILKRGFGRLLSDEGDEGDEGDEDKSSEESDSSMETRK